MENIFSVRGKVALVTGGTQGIGLMIAEGFAEAGATVYIAARTRADCEQVAKRLSGLGECVGLVADLSTEAGCVGLARDLAARTDRLDILVNNAGTGWMAPLEEFGAEGWDGVLDLNLKAPFYLLRELVPLLRAAGTQEEPARVINIGSSDALRLTEMPTYSATASKAAIHALTRMFAHNLAPTVTVNVIAPGSFPSRMMAGVLEQLGEVIEAVTPLRRIGRPSDIVGAAIYLCSRAGAYVTGTILAVDGGLSTARAGFVPAKYLPAEAA